MKVLIVHDRQEISEVIESIVQRIADDNHSVAVTKDVYGARQKLEAEIYDLLIIDLTIPLLRNGTISYQYAAQLLEELFNTESMNVPGDVIGITKDESAISRIDASISPHLMVSINEDKDGKWKEYLLEKLLYARRASKTRSISINQHYDYDALILTALDKEFLPFKEFFEFQEVKHFHGALSFNFSDQNGHFRRGIA